jgi:hypothetical protein
MIIWVIFSYLMKSVECVSMKNNLTQVHDNHSLYEITLLKERRKIVIIGPFLFQNFSQYLFIFVLIV